MPFVQLAQVQHRIAVGVPLPFGIRNAEEMLLLARGQVIESLEQLDALLNRGAVVDLEEVEDPADEIRRAPPQALAGLWDQCMNQVRRSLQADVQESAAFMRTLDDVSAPVLALIERDADLAIFQVLRQDPRQANHYGVRHSVHKATVCYLASQRLGGSPDECRRAFRSALTSNISMIELQGRLAQQVTPLTTRQREVIREHPLRSVELLQANGVQDMDWLRAVAEHHEVADGSGYPLSKKDVSPLAHLINRADVFTAKLSGRVNRGAMPADRAARELFIAQQTSAATAAILKEFGVFPPGTFVKLASGEAGVVIRRGSSAKSPIVAALVNRIGEPMLDPLKRDTANPAFNITAVVPEQSLRVRVPPERLAALTAL